MGFPQRLLADDEKLVLVLRRHIKVLFLPILVLVLCVAGFAAAAVLSGGNAIVMIIAAVVVLVIAARAFLWPFLVWFNTVYAITTRRLILRAGVFNRTGHDMPLTRLNDVSFKHSLFERMIGCGTLVVESGGEQGQLLLDDIPKVELVQRTLYRLADDLRVARTDGKRDDEIDPSLARTLDDAFDEEYRGPAASGKSAEPGSGEHNS